MLIKTRRSGMVWVDWPPVEDGEVWCLGASSDGRYLTAYRAVDGCWEAVAWEELASEAPAGGGQRREHVELH